MRMFSQPETKKLASLTPVTHDNDVYTILAGQLFDSYARKLVPRQCIKVHKLSGLILDVSTYKDEDYLGLHTNNSLLDLRHLTVLPGFVDVHVHCELSIPRALMIY
jgi:cytosine/adenosine deaminase-related metal-dependent hydrolase